MSVMNINLPKVGGREGYFKTFRYPAGEVQTRISDEKYLKSLKEAEKIVLNMQYTSGDDLIILAQVLNIIGYNYPNKRRTVELFIPYLPFGRADRIFTDGDCHGLTVFSRTLLDICKTFHIHKIITLDNHNKNTAEWFKNASGIEFQELSAEPYILSAIKRELCVWDFDEVSEPAINILFPDEGAAKRYSLPDQLFGNVGTIKINKVFATKKRDATTGEFLGFEVPDKIEFIEDAPILIVDDICDGGGTFIGICDELTKNGVNDLRFKISLFVTHGIFSKGVGELGKRFFRVYTTDSIVYAHHNSEALDYGIRRFVDVFNIIHS